MQNSNLLEDDSTLEERVRINPFAKAVDATRRFSRSAKSMAKDPYLRIQGVSSLLERAARFWVVHKIITGNDNSIWMDAAEIGVITLVSSAIYEPLTSLVHYGLYRRKKGTTKGFLDNRLKAEAAHYKIKGIATGATTGVTVGIESLWGIPREISTQVAGIPFGLTQAVYNTLVRKRVDAGIPLNSLMDRSVNFPYTTIYLMARYAKIPKAVGGLTKIGGSVVSTTKAARKYAATLLTFTR